LFEWAELAIGELSLSAKLRPVLCALAMSLALGARNQPL